MNESLLWFPDRVATDLPRLDLSEIGSLQFLAHDVDQFPAFRAVLAAANKGGSALAAVNASDEVLIERFLAGDIPFLGIAQGLQQTVNEWTGKWGSNDEPLTLDRLLSVDRWARQKAQNLPLTPA